MKLFRIDGYFWKIIFRLIFSNSLPSRRPMLQPPHYFVRKFEYFSNSLPNRLEVWIMVWRLQTIDIRTIWKCRYFYLKIFDNWSIVFILRSLIFLHKFTSLTENFLWFRIMKKSYRISFTFVLLNGYVLQIYKELEINVCKQS